MLGKKCVFCGMSAQSRDHIPSKSLLEKPYPVNLLTVPSCIKCNYSYSMDEEYFINVLVEIATNPTLTQKKAPNGPIFRSRARSIKLRDRIEGSLVEGENGRTYITPEYKRIKKVIEKNALGLYFHKYRCLPNLQKFSCTGIYPYNILDMRPPEIFLLAFTERFKSKKWTIIQKDVFSYIVVRDWRNREILTMIFDIHNTAWCVIEVPLPNLKKRRNSHSMQQIDLFGVN